MNKGTYLQLDSLFSMFSNSKFFSAWTRNLCCEDNISYFFCPKHFCLLITAACVRHNRGNIVSSSASSVFYFRSRGP